MKFFQLTFMLLLVLFVSCGKKNANVSSNDTANIEYLSSQHLMQKQLEYNSSIIGKGYSSFENSIKNNCLENTTYEFIANGRSQISFYHNLSSNELNEKLNINTNGKINSIQGNGSFDINYLSNSDNKDLSTTVTLIANVTNGKNTLIKSSNDLYGYRLNDFYRAIFEKKKAEFIKVCGDGVVESQKLSAFLVITARIDFKNKETKYEFESKIGADKNIFQEISSNGELKIFQDSKNIKNDIKITISGLQLGGDFTKLQTILKKNVCNLNQIEQCNQMFDTINEYFSNEFQNQLDINNPNLWITSEIKTIPYSQLIILNDKGEYFSDQFNFGLDYANFSDKLAFLKEKNVGIRKNIKKILDHSNAKYFSNEELLYLNRNLLSSENNLNVIEDFFTDCKSLKSLDNCLSKYLKEAKEYFLPVDNKLSNLEIENHVISYNAGIDNITINEIPYKKRDIENRIFTDQKNLKFVLLDFKRNEIKDQNIELYCEKKFRNKIDSVHKGVWFSFILNVWPTIYTIISKAVNEEYYLLDIITNNKKTDILLKDIEKYCGNQATLFIASKPESLVNKIEIWEGIL